MGKRSGSKRKDKNKVILPPELPPEVDDDKVYVSEEDIDFFGRNRFPLFDQKVVDRYVGRTANPDEGEVERLYEEREKRKALRRPREQDDDLEVDPVDALPIKNLQGELVYNRAKKARTEENTGSMKSKDQENGADAKQNIKKDELKGKSKNKKGDGKVKNAESQMEGPKGKLHSDVLEEVKDELSAEELFEKKKAQLAELGMAMLEDPESNIRSLNDMLTISNDKDQKVVKLGLMSLLAVFKDIIPSYRIRQLTEKELTVEVSKEVKKTRYFEYTLIRCYKAYLQKLISLEKQPHFYPVAVRCMCALLDTAPHFNFRENLLAGVVKNLSSSDDVVRKMCFETIRSIFINEGKHRGEATIEAVRLIADRVKLNDCQLHPDSIEVFLSLRFDEDIGEDETEEQKVKPKKNKRGQNHEAPKQLPVSDKKKTKQELISKAREEVDADLRAVSFTLDPRERKRIQRETLSAMFETYFRILKHSMSTSNSRSKANIVSPGASHPLLPPCLEGLGKFSHLIDLDFMGELITCLKKLSGYSDHQDERPHDNTLSVSERMQCCIVAFKVWRSNLEALNVDLQDFFVQLYNLILEYRPDRDRGEVLADALKTLLWEGKQQDMLRAAAFIKRLATFALSFGSAEAIAALVTLKHLLQKNSKCRNMLENDSGGGSLSCLVAKYNPEAKDPYLSGALASVLWELSLLEKHYDISVSSMASNILSMATLLNPTQNPVPILNVNPLEAYRDLSIERELSKPVSKALSLNLKKKRRGKEFVALSPDVLKKADCSVDRDELREKLQSHFTVLRGISENERMRAELNHTLSSINMYKEYKKQKKNMKSKIGRKKVAKA